MNRTDNESRISRERNEGLPIGLRLLSVGIDIKKDLAHPTRSLLIIFLIEEGEFAQQVRVAEGVGAGVGKVWSQEGFDSIGYRTNSISERVVSLP